MKIMVVTPCIYQLPLRGYGGLEKIAEDLIKGYLNSGHQVSVVAPEGSVLPEGAELIPMALRESEESAYHKYSDQMADFDIVHDHTFEGWPYVASIGRNPQLQVCHTFHTSPGIWSSPPPVPRPNMIGISQNHSRSLAMQLGVPCKTVYNGSDTSFYSPPAKDKARNGRYLFMGRYTAEKGPLEAIQMAKKLRVPLDLYGDTEMVASQDYVDRCRNEADGLLVRYNQGISRSETVEVYQKYKALLFLPNWDEPHGLVLVEAQLCGLPVITLNRGSMSEVVKHGKSGFVCDTSEEVEDIIRNDKIEKIDPAAPRRWATRFSTEKMTANYLGLFEEILDIGGW